MQSGWSRTAKVLRELQAQTSAKGTCILAASNSNCTVFVHVLLHILQRNSISLYLYNMAILGCGNLALKNQFFPKF